MIATSNGLMASLEPKISNRPEMTPISTEHRATASEILLIRSSTLDEPDMKIPM
ncbi:hypothetical protein MspRI1_29450 [Marinobacter sp. RI1]